VSLSPPPDLHDAITLAARQQLHDLHCWIDAHPYDNLGDPRVDRVAERHLALDRAFLSAALVKSPDGPFLLEPLCLLNVLSALHEQEAESQGGFGRESVHEFIGHSLFVGQLIFGGAGTLESSRLSAAERHACNAEREAAARKYEKFARGYYGWVGRDGARPLTTLAAERAIKASMERHAAVLRARLLLKAPSVNALELLQLRAHAQGS
jgi:hypothetical protein